MKGPSIKMENGKTHIMLGNKEVMECGGLIKEMTRIQGEDFKMGNKKEEGKLTDEQVLSMAESMFEYAENDLEKHFDHMVERAERLVHDLKKQRNDFNEKKDSANENIITRGGQFESTLRTVQNCFNNFDTSDAARKLARYEKSKAVLASLKGERVNLW